MKFFFPDSLDQVDPSFDFINETRSNFRVRQRDDLYAHEIFETPPYDGLLISKGIVDGVGAGTSKYSMSQRHRLYRLGVQEFFRLDSVRHKKLETIGDCGAFSYVKEEKPPYTVDEVIDFYETCNFDYGISIDHVILGYNQKLDYSLPNLDIVPPDWRERQKITLDLAEIFLKRHQDRHCRFIPVGVVQGWSPHSYAEAFAKLQDMGYKMISLGGLVPLKTQEILDILNAISPLRKAEVGIHLLGVTRLDSIQKFQDYGVVSFDSTSPLRKAFMDEKDNYFTNGRTFSAIRVPQVDASPKLRKRIASGEIDQVAALELEKRCMKALHGFDTGITGMDDTITALRDYEDLVRGPDYDITAYEEALKQMPWKNCDCDICRSIGINVIIFRGAERNRRRGFHNLYVFYKMLEGGLRQECEIDPIQRSSAAN